MTINEALQRFRQEHHLTRKEVADALGIKPQSYIYEKKNVIPSAKVIRELAEIYNVSADYLLGLSDQPTPAAVPAPMVDDELAQAALAFAAVVQKKIKEQSVIEEGAE